MPTKLSTKPVAVIAALAATGTILAGSSAKAACINPASCTIFDASTPTSVVSLKPPYANSVAVIGAPPAPNTFPTYFGVEFTIGNVQTPISNPIITNLKVDNAYGFGGTVNFGNVSIPDNGVVTNSALRSVAIAFPAPTPPATNLDFSNYAISFDLPVLQRQSPTSSIVISTRLFYGATGTWDSITNYSTFFKMTEIPGPLPILGAASAFGFSRSLRRRIKTAKAV